MSDEPTTPETDASLRLGTRGSALALRQSGMIAAELERLGVAVEMVVIKTSGDVATGSLAALGLVAEPAGRVWRNLPPATVYRIRRHA